MDIWRKPLALDLTAFGLCLLAVLGNYLVADRIYEHMPHFEDEMAYVWQAQAIAGGSMLLPSPPEPKSFVTPFVVDRGGVRSSKYPPGWPAMLGLGLLLGVRGWVNPLLAGVGIWLLYRLGAKLDHRGTGLIAAFLMTTSPMFWLLSASLLSHAFSLFLALAFSLSWLDAFFAERRQAGVPGWITVLLAGVSLGALGLTRPVTALAVAGPFLLHGLWMLASAERAVRHRVLAIGALALTLAGLLFVWQYAVTGDPFGNPYSLWWAYDRYGFGEGFGRAEGGHDLERAWENLRYSLRASGTGGDVLGWGGLWWVFLPFGAWRWRRTPAAWLAAAILPAEILAYLPYWIGSWQYGPRYYYEGMLSLTLLSAAGIRWLLAGGLPLRRAAALLAVLVLVGSNLCSYLPARVARMRGMYGIQRAMLEPFLTLEAQALSPALVIVSHHQSWTEYGGLLELQNAQLSTPFIFAWNRGPRANQALASAFPERRVLYYYPEEPDRFYDRPR